MLPIAFGNRGWQQAEAVSAVSVTVPAALVGCSPAFTALQVGRSGLEEQPLSATLATVNLLSHHQITWCSLSVLCQWEGDLSQNRNGMSSVDGTRDKILLHIRGSYLIPVLCRPTICFLLYGQESALSQVQINMKLYDVPIFMALVYFCMWIN